MPPSPFELLNFLFVTVARKPLVLHLREGAAVARYLDDLVYEMPPGPERQLISLFCKAIWGRVFQFSKFRTATKEETIEFLERFAQTHLATYDTVAAVKAVSTSSAPKPHVTPSVLRAPGVSVTLGQGNKNFSDDLSERICAGYWALRLAGEFGARGHVAKALNHYGIRTRSRTGDAAWTGAEVDERTKQHEARAFPKGPKQVAGARKALVAMWQELYYPINWVHPPYLPPKRSDVKAARQRPVTS
jgi:hypothetical protein